MLRQAQIAKYLNLIYEDSFQDWQKKRHDQLLDIARHALALQKFRAERMPPGATTLETFADFRDQSAELWTSDAGKHRNRHRPIQRKTSMNGAGIIWPNSTKPPF